MTAADKIAFATSLLMLMTLYVVCWSGSGLADEVAITAAGRTQVFPLSRDRRIAVHGRLGDSVIEIRSGRARFIASPCSGKVCIHAGWINRAGATTACVPNGVIVSVTGDDAAKVRYDAINF
ncbi:MAG: NusG domain II-containing protein [Pseudomonadota bacterium]|nr:NusG domain II-containing protein [Pseudomonadota bacterium]